MGPTQFELVEETESEEEQDILHACCIWWIDKPLDQQFSFCGKPLSECGKPVMDWTECFYYKPCEECMEKQKQHGACSELGVCIWGLD